MFLLSSFSVVSVFLFGGHGRWDSARSAVVKIMESCLWGA